MVVRSVSWGWCIDSACSQSDAEREDARTGARSRATLGPPHNQHPRINPMTRLLAPMAWRFLTVAFRRHASRVSCIAQLAPGGGQYDVLALVSPCPSREHVGVQILVGSEPNHLLLPLTPCQ